MEHANTMLVFAAVVAYAWIAKVQAPPKVVNVVAWTFALILSVLVVIAIVPWPR